MGAHKRASNFRHVVIDMQRLFAEKTAWHTPALASILPNVVRLSTALRSHTLFARFIVPRTAEAAEGSWQGYYQRWSMITGPWHDPALHNLVEQLLPLANEANMFDKLGYSVFAGTDLHRRLEHEQVGTLIFSGIESDVCVYASVMAAIDLGYEVILATDALASADDRAHKAVLDVLAPRLPEQISLMSTQAILDNWAQDLNS
ncbi:cysteine hydrolase family protein [Rhizobium sp. NPDC090279]|uniref:cysteine hydrolase family protein n=1 Tax=Rhizobium sp. NPDC090279 TaxID=3364499 RepID=UPI00383B6B01